MEQSNSDTFAIRPDLIAQDLINTTTDTTKQQVTTAANTKIQVSSDIQRNGRRKLEDRFVTEHDLNLALDLENLKHKYRYYAIFDGHVNERAAEYCKDNLHINLAYSQEFKDGNIRQALINAFVKTDEDFCESLGNDSLRPGTTALVCLIEDERRLYLAWAGDSTSILIRNGEPVQLTTAHTPEIESERKRIEQMGGNCLYTNMWRVDGTLAVTRSIGDPDFKPYVTGEPEICEYDLNGSEDFLVMGSDGLYDSLTSEDVSTIVYEFLALNADQISSNDKQKEIVDQISKLLIQRSIEEGSSDNITSIVIFFKDLATIAPTLTINKPTIIKQNGHQNGHHLNGHNNDHTSDEQQEVENGFNNGNNDKENGRAFQLNVNAAPFSPNDDLLNSISMSGVDTIRTTRQQKVWEDCLQANLTSNITSNEDNQHDNLQCAIDDEMLINNENSDEEQPHSILPNINEQLNEAAAAAIQQPVVVVEQINEEEDELQRELDEERIISVNDEDLNEVEELKETSKTVECEYGVIPTESTASPIDLISESTTTEQQDDKGSNENLPTSPFEQIEEHQQKSSSEDNEQDAIQTFEALEQENEIQQNQDDTMKDEDLAEEGNIIENDIEEKSEENSFEFISHQDLPNQQQSNSQDQNVTQYESPENSSMKIIGAADDQEISVYEAANANFENSILNKDLLNQYRDNEQVDQEEENDEHPFENDSEDSIKYMDKTATEEKINQALEHAIESIQTNEINDLADLMQNANINENTNDNREEDNEIAPSNQTFNLLEDTRDQENIDEINKENVPQIIKPTLLDATLVFNGNPPSLIEPTTQINEDDQLLIDNNQFNDDNDENQQPITEQINQESVTSSNFELIKDEEVIESTNNRLVEDNQTNYKAFDMDLTNCAKTQEFSIQLNTQAENEVPNTIDENEAELMVVLDEQEISSSGAQDATLTKPDSAESSNDYVVADQDPSFLHKAQQPIIDAEQPIPAVEERVDEILKDNFVVLESEPSKQLMNDNNNVESNDELITDQISELKIAVESNDDSKPIDNKLEEKEVVNEIPKEAVIATSAVVGAAAAVALASSKDKKKPTTTTNKQPLSKAKLTKDTKLLVKDSKSPAILKNTKTTTTTSTIKSASTLNKKPIASSITNKSSTLTATRKPLTTTRPTSTISSKPSGPLATAKPLTSKPAVSKVSSTLKSTATSRLNTGTSSAKSTTLASSKPATKPIAKLSAATSKLTTTSKTMADVKPKSTLASTTSRPTVGSKYANVTSRVSSSLSSAPKSSTATASRPSTTNVAKASSTALTKKPLSTSTLRSTTSAASTKPSTATSRLTATSKVSSSLQRSTVTAPNSRLLNSKNSKSATSTTNAKPSSAAATKKPTSTITAVPRKPISKQQENSSKLNNNESDSQEEVKNDEINSNSTKPNSHLTNGQSNGQPQTNSNNLSNGDAPANTIPSSITSSKSRDKLANSLKAELEAAQMLSGGCLPK